jgi:hypothetical protein
MRRFANVALLVASCLVASLLVSVVPQNQREVLVSRTMGEQFVFDDGLSVRPQRVHVGGILTRNESFVARTSDAFLLVDVRLASTGRIGGGALEAEIVSGGRVYSARSSLVIPQAGFYSDDGFVFEIPRSALQGARMRLSRLSFITSIHNVPDYDLDIAAADVAGFSPSAVVTTPTGAEEAIP